MIRGLRFQRAHRAIRLSAPLLLVALLSGCRGSGSVEPPDVRIEQGSPEEAARSVVRVLREQKRLKTEGRPAEAEALERLIRQRLAAVDRVEALVRTMLEQTGRHSTRDAIQKGAVRAIGGWAALLGYYVDEMPLEQAARISAEVDGFVQIRIPAGPRARTGVRFICERGKDQLWRVITIDFETPPASAAPPSPASVAPSTPTTPAAPSSPATPAAPAATPPATASPAQLTPPAQDASPAGAP